MSTSERFTLTNRQGRRIVGLIDYPGESGPVERVLVLCHGYGGDKDGRYLQAIAHAIVSARGATVRFDFTDGMGESDGALANASVAGYAADLEDVLDFVASQPRLAKSALAIGGHSYAGQVVLVVAARRPRLLGVFFLAGLYERAGAGSMAAVVARIRAPIVIIHAGADREVARAQADALVVAAGSKVISYQVVLGADHNFTVADSAYQLGSLLREDFFALPLPGTT